MTKTERQIYNLLENYKFNIQYHLDFSPMALSNFHHISDRLLDKRDGCEKAFKKNIKEMLKNGVEPTTFDGIKILSELRKFAGTKQEVCSFFRNAVERHCKRKRSL